MYNARTTKYTHRSLVLFAVLLSTAAVAAPAFGSAIIGPNVSRPTLAIDGQGHAHVSYSAEDTGRNIYLDAFDSAYGQGWRRENSFLTHHRGHTLGDFCYGLFPHADIRQARERNTARRPKAQG